MIAHIKIPFAIDILLKISKYSLFVVIEFFLKHFRGKNTLKVENAVKLYRRKEIFAVESKEKYLF